MLITGHRRENFGDGFIRMVTAMKDLSEKYPEVDFWIESGASADADKQNILEGTDDE